MKKILIAILFISVLALSFSGCNFSNNGDIVVLPDYDSKINDESYKLIIRGWNTPVMTDESVNDYIDCGFNQIYLLGPNANGLGSQTVNNAMDLCEKYSLPAIIDCGRLLDLIFQTDYSDYDTFLGICFDEPTINDTETVIGINTIANYVEAFEEHYPGKTFLVNLNPSTAPHLGGTYDEYLTATCENFLSRFSTGERWLSADDYPLFYNASNKTQKYYLKKSWLENLEYLSNYKSEYENIKSNFFIQSMPYEIYHDRIPSYNDLRLQAYTVMAFGYDSISYFCYATPPVNFEYSDTQFALIDREGNKTETYFSAKQLNNQLLNFDHVYKHFKWQGVSAVTGSNNIQMDEFYSNGSFDLLHSPLKVNSIGKINSVNATEDTLIGYLKDQNNNDGYMVVNYNETTLNLTDNIEIVFNNTNYALVYIDGVKNIVKLNKNKLSLTLEPGEGVFVIPYG